MKNCIWCSLSLEAHPCGGRRISSDALLATLLEDLQADKVGMTNIEHHRGYQPQGADARGGVH